MKVVLFVEFLFVFVCCFALGCFSAFLDVFLKKRQLKKYGLTSLGNVYLDRFQVVSCKSRLGENLSKDDLRFLQAFDYFLSGGLVG